MPTGGRLAGRAVPAWLAVGLALAAAGCGPADPRQALLEERARWNVELLSFIQTEESVRCTLRVSGPVTTSLETLTVRIELIDATENPIGEVWEPLDVSGIRRGTPTEMRVTLPGSYPEVAGAWAEIVRNPTAEQAARIVELQGVP